MLARPLVRPDPQQLFGETPAVLGEALKDGVNLAVWRRQLHPHLADFAQRLVSSGDLLAESLTIELDTDGAVPAFNLATAYQDLAGHAGFVADISWLVGAFACLLEARVVGLRLRILDKAMCPRFHVDHAPLRLITTYAGAASQWLREDVIPRHHLGKTAAEPIDVSDIEQLHTGEVALFKGERWQGNEGAGIVHRSPQVEPGERRLILTLDWLA